MSAIWVLKSPENRQYLIQYLMTLPLKGQVVTIAKKHHTPPQGRYLNMLCRILDESLGEKEDYHKTKYKFATMPLETVRVGDQNFLWPLSSTKADNEACSKMIELALTDFQQAGLIAPDPKMLGLTL